MDDYEKFIEWLVEREEDEQLVAWLQIIGSIDELEGMPIAKPH